MADIKEPNRKTIRSVDWMSNKSFNAMKKDKARAAELRMTYEQFSNEICKVLTMYLKEEITFVQRDAMIAELKGI